ncbi:MAG: bifunctional 5,10-methylenetetrahydrofolate dehydrogenase/5,10-methenyltetrahydrofolate cyclohydrolase [Bacilli bacterium]
MILDGKQLSGETKEMLKNKIKHYLIKPCLAVIQVGDDEASNIYIKAKANACNEIGLYFKHIKFNVGASEKEVINKIIELNNDDYVDGILIQLPLPLKFDEYKLINLINKEKDVDGLTDTNMGKLFKGHKGLVPCTPLGIINLLKANDIKISGKHAVIVGRSNLVGKPLAMLLLENDATVTICHSKTDNLINYTLTADILISATGCKNLITSDMVKKDCVVVDVGMSRVDGKLCGDVASDVMAAYITPVPGGVGPMTVCTLLQNVLKNYEKKGEFPK